MAKAHAALAHSHWVRETNRYSRRGPRLGRGTPIRPEHLSPFELARMGHPRGAAPQMVLG
jgi:hypothetical protein